MVSFLFPTFQFISFLFIVVINLICCLIFLSFSLLKNENQIKRVCNISLLYFSIMFAINKICRDEEGMMEMLNSCSALILFKYLVLNLKSPKD